VTLWLLVSLQQELLQKELGMYVEAVATLLLQHWHFTTGRCLGPLTEGRSSNSSAYRMYAELARKRAKDSD
jgi:hypothetical protein